MADDLISDIVALRSELSKDPSLRIELLGQIVSVFRQYGHSISPLLLSKITLSSKDELKNAGLSSVDPPSQATPIADPK